MCNEETIKKTIVTFKALRRCTWITWWRDLVRSFVGKGLLSFSTWMRDINLFWKVPKKLKQCARGRGSKLFGQFPNRPKNYSGVSHQEKSCRSMKILKKAREWKSSFSCLVVNSISCFHPLRETSLNSITNRPGSHNKKGVWKVKSGPFPAPQRGRPLPVRDLWLLGHFLPGSQQQDLDGQISALRWLNKAK